MMVLYIHSQKREPSDGRTSTFGHPLKLSLAISSHEVAFCGISLSSRFQTDVMAATFFVKKHFVASDRQHGGDT